MRTAPCRVDVLLLVEKNAGGTTRVLEVSRCWPSQRQQRNGNSGLRAHQARIGEVTRTASAVGKRRRGYHEGWDRPLEAS
jgi:hypothetical protein